MIYLRFDLQELEMESRSEWEYIFSMFYLRFLLEEMGYRPVDPGIHSIEVIAYEMGMAA